MSEIPPSFQYQLDMLKIEVDVINQTIRQMDDISKSLKEWSITVWAGSVGGAIATDALHPFMFATAIIPIVFWLSDAHHHVVQRKFIWRSLLIKDFLNDQRLAKSFEAGKLVDFSVMDPASRTCSSPQMAEFISWQKVIFFRTMSILYLGLAACSIAIWAFLP